MNPIHEVTQLGIRGLKWVDARTVALAARVRGRRVNELDREAMEPSFLGLAEIKQQTFDDVTRELGAIEAEHWVISHEPALRSQLGVRAEDRAQVARALRKLAGSGYWVRGYVGGERTDVLLSEVDTGVLCAENDIVVLFVPRRLAQTNRIILGDGSCEVEFWNTVETDEGTMIVAPRENRASAELSPQDFELVETSWMGRTVKTPQVLLQRMLDDITFPIDVVYTWVDGSDEKWLEKRARAQALEEGSPTIQRRSWPQDSRITRSCATRFGRWICTRRGFGRSSL